MQKVRTCKNISNKKRKINKFITDQTTMTAFHDSVNFPKARIIWIHCALIKVFVCCEISFKIVKHHFFINLLKELNTNYNSSMHKYLSKRLLETELCNINERVNEKIIN
jgi:hypothetical protein